jgi:hypothetical protein
MTITLEELIAAGELQADRILIKERQKALLPMFHLVAPEGGQDAVVATPWSNDFEKKLSVAQVKFISHQMGAVAVMFLTECWMVTAKLDVPNTPWHRQRQLDRMGRPSQSPDRIEAVIIIATDGSRTKATTLQMIRDKPGGKLISLVKDEVLSRDTDNYESWMFDGMLRAKE